MGITHDSHSCAGLEVENVFLSKADQRIVNELYSGAISGKCPPSVDDLGPSPQHWRLLTLDSSAYWALSMLRSYLRLLCPLKLLSHKSASARYSRFLLHASVGS